MRTLVWVVVPSFVACGGTQVGTSSDSGSPQEAGMSPPGLRDAIVVAPGRDSGRADARSPRFDAAITLDSGADSGVAPESGAPDAAMVFPSCRGLAPTCGPDGRGDCCESLQVPGGTFTLGHGPGDPEQASCAALFCTVNEVGVPAKVSAFSLDRYEVTVGRFRKFVEAGAPVPAAGAGKHAHLAGGGIQGERGWDPAWQLTTDWNAFLKCDTTNPAVSTWTPTPGAYEARPVTCLDWFDAYAFCIWDGGFLPTEAEWEFAASGGEERVFPWSVPASDPTLTPDLASFADSAGHCFGDGLPDCTRDDFLAVGSKPLGNGRFGQSDLSGNVWEWVLDWYDKSYANPCNDCANTTDSGWRTVRSGCALCTAANDRAASRFSHHPDGRYSTQGVRCARSG